VSNLLAKGSQFLSDTLANKASRTVTYRRGSKSASVVAVIGGAESQEIDEGGIVSRRRFRDYIVRVVDAPGWLTEPMDGDYIDDTSSDGDGLRYEVRPPSGLSEPSWRHTDQHRNAWRIHTQVLGRAPSS